MIVRCALVLVAWLALPGIGAAQSSGDYDIPPAPTGYDAQPTATVPSELSPPVELEAAESNWPELSPHLADGVLFPVGGTQPDDGIVLNGLGWFIAFYVVGLASTLPFSFSCRDPASGIFAFVPLAQWAAGLCNSGAAAGAATVGITMAFLQFVGLMTLIAGLSHHRDVIRPRARVGEVALTPNGLEVAF